MAGGFRTVGELVLASASPRRRRFLQELGLEFTIAPAEIDETPRVDEKPENYVLRLSREKACAVSRYYPEACVLAADTIVVLDDEILGKPVDCRDAVCMLGRLSGRWHEVLTGFCLFRHDAGLLANEAAKTRVLFRALPEKLRLAYALTGEPLDKAGGYGLQGRGGFLVECIEGSYSNVIGLPVAEIVDKLLLSGVIAPNLEDAQ